jgi:citrate lyase subunit beta / citryl-CoA lyase
MREVRLRRSELSTPASEERMIQSATRSAADLVFLDLEDAVAPNAKDAARAKAVEAVRGLDWGTKTLAVRVNGVCTPWCYEDVVDVVLGAGDRLDLLIVPKVKAPRDVWFVETLLDQLETKLGRAKPLALEVLIEEAEALACVEEIARSSPRLETLILGFGDLSASLGMSLHADYPGDRWNYARGRVVAAARAAGIEAIDGPFANYRDPDRYREEAQRAAVMGFTGKWAIHPSQIELANEAFSPAPEEVERARALIAAMRESEQAGAGAASFEGAMIDAAVARAAEVVVAKADLVERTARS